jgi:hypothetical protein
MLHLRLILRLELEPKGQRLVVTHCHVLCYAWNEHEQRGKIPKGKFQGWHCASTRKCAASSNQEQPGAATSSEEQPGAARSDQERPGVARSSQDQPGAARSRQEQRAASSSQKQPRELNMSTTHAQERWGTPGRSKGGDYVVRERSTLIMKMSTAHTREHRPTHGVAKVTTWRERAAHS